MAKAWRIFKKTVWGVLLTLFFLLCFVLLWLAADKFILGSPVPSFFGYSTLTVETGSMSGTIEIGDMILIQKQDEYKSGEIITFLPEGDSIPTTHRIVGYVEGGYETKGDANNAEDRESIEHERVLGKVIDVYPRVGLFAQWVRTEGWLYLVSMLAILGLGSLIIKSDEEDGEETEETDEDPEENTEETPSKDQSNEENSQGSPPSAPTAVAE